MFFSLKNTLKITTLALLIIAGQAYAKSHALIIAVCPPWKDGGDKETTSLMAESCAKTTKLVQDSLKESLMIPLEQQHVFLNEDATYQKVVDGINNVKTQLTPNDRLLVYVNAHGGHLQGKYNGYDIADEGIAFWTEKEPDLKTAVDNKQYMLVKAFRDLILENMPANEIAVFFDSCETGASYDDFRYNPYANDKRIAVVFSAQKDQFANFNHSFDYPLFTEMLTKSLALSAYRDLAYSIDLAASATHRTQRARCNVPEVRETYKKWKADLNAICLQQPYYYDPTALLEDWVVIPDES